MSPLKTAVVIKRPKQIIFKDFFYFVETCVGRVYPFLKKQSIPILTACESGARVSHRNNSILRVYLTNWQRKKKLSEPSDAYILKWSQLLASKQTTCTHSGEIREISDFKRWGWLWKKKLLLNKPCWKSCFTSHRKKCYHLGRCVSYEKREQQVI